MALYVLPLAILIPNVIIHEALPPFPLCVSVTWLIDSYLPNDAVTDFIESGGKLTTEGFRRIECIHI
jgi:hypothetical protein